MKVLIPLDGSELSESALDWAATQAQMGPLQVHLLRVVDPFLVAPGGVPPSLGERMQHQILEAAGDYLEGVKQRFGGLVTETQAVVGQAREEIGVTAQRHAVDLIVMASHGRSGLGRWLLGSVAEGVLRIAPCPVLLLRPSTSATHHPFEKILVPVDGSPASLQVPRQLAPFVSGEARVTLVRCTGLSLMDYSEADIAPALQEYLEGLRHRMEALKEEGLAAEVLLVDGEAPDGILEAAQERACDLIAMSTHGHGGFRHFWMGSVTERVARRAPCPVLVFPSPPPPSEET